MDKRIRYNSILIISFLLLNLNSVAFSSFDKLHGFVNFDCGVKLSNDNTRNDSLNLLEQKLQLKTAYYFEGNNYLSNKGALINFKADATLDEYYAGKTSVDIREFNLSLTPLDSIDLKLGRQVLTWGTGDYLFINDMFPKDYVSFFVGREDEYLKKPSDAIKMSFFPKLANIDFIVIPYFTPNSHATGDRLSLFDSFQGGISGINSDRDIISPPMQMENNEYAMRIYKNINGNELALYAFNGFDKSPRSYKNEMNRQLYYEKLDVYGASVQGAIFNGIGNLEVGYYNSREDPTGEIRTIENSMFKAMTGYNKDMGNDLKIGFQYYYEQKLDYDNYNDNLLTADYRWDEFKHVITNRITKFYKNQTVLVSLFSFYSPSDKDGYIRPSINYDLNDSTKLSFGANLAFGEDDLTEFGQNKRNKNIFFRIKYNF